MTRRVSCADSVSLRRGVAGSAAVVLTLLTTVSMCIASCSRPSAQATTEPAAPPKAVTLQSDEVRIGEASRQFVEVEPVAASKTAATLTMPARVEFRDGAVSQVGPPLDGRVTAVHVTVGQRVRAGDPLVTIDAPDAASTRAAGSIAQASLREARLELERQRRMEQEGVGIERDVVAAETKVSAAEAELARVEATTATFGTGTGARITVPSPISGVVITRKASAGLAVQRGGDPIVEIGDPSSVWIVADVFERDLPRVRAGASGRVLLTSVDHPIPARIAAVGAVVASSLRTVPVYLTLAANATGLRPGMYGRVELDDADLGMTLPVAAVLIKDGKDPVVYVQKDQLTFVRRRVVVGPPVNGRVPILSGLAPGERVVVRGALLLDGSAEQLL